MLEKRRNSPGKQAQLSFFIGSLSSITRQIIRDAMTPKIDQNLKKELMDLSIQMLKISCRMHLDPDLKKHKETLKRVAITMLTLAADYTEEPKQP